MNSTTKTALLAKAQEMLRDQIKDIQRQLTELQESSEVEEKSSAGDKFETHQEMLHQTRDILEKRLASSRVMLAQLNAVPVKEMEKVDMPEVPEFLDILYASGVKMWACKLAFDMFHYKEEDLYEGVDDIITVGDFYKRSEGEGVHMLFI